MTITSVEIVLLSSEPNPYELAFIYEMLIFYNFMTANCKITQVLIEFKLYLVDFILVNNKVISYFYDNDNYNYDNYLMMAWACELVISAPF